MSELAYMTHLKQINGRLEFRQINLNIDLCVDYLHLLDQVNVLDQYLYYNNLLLRENNSSGYRDLDGFEDKTVIEWNKENNEKEQNKLLEKKIRKLLYIKRNTIEEPIRIHRFDISEFNEIEEPEYLESDLDELEQNIESSDEIIEKGLDPIEEDNCDLFDTISEEQSIEENEEEIEKTFNTIDEDIEAEQELEDNTPLLGDMYNDLVQANQLLEDTEDDNYDFVDEYAIEDDEEEIDKTFEENEEETDYSEEFEFENPSNLNSLENNTNTSFTNTYQRDIRTTDKMVDKTTDVINQGINNILKRLAGK